MRGELEKDSGITSKGKAESIVNMQVDSHVKNKIGNQYKTASEVGINNEHNG